MFKALTPLKLSACLACQAYKFFYRGSWSHFFSSRSTLRSLPDSELATFFEQLVRQAEPDANEFFVRDAATELKNAFHVDGMSLEEEHQKASLLFKVCLQRNLTGAFENCNRKIHKSTSISTKSNL